MREENTGRTSFNTVLGLKSKTLVPIKQLYNSTVRRKILTLASTGDKVTLQNFPQKKKKKFF